MKLQLLACLSLRHALAFSVFKQGSLRPATSLDAAVGIFFGTSTGNTERVADLIYEAFGPELAAEPVDIDTIEAGKLAEVFAQNDALVVGTPTWNTGADTERSGTGWDEVYYTKFPELDLVDKKVAVFGLGDQVSYAENYADATGELYSVFKGLGCQMMGHWDTDGYEHESTKSMAGDKFCGLLLDEINQEDLTEERVEQWVAQLKEEGILEGSGSSASVPAASTTVSQAGELESSSELLEQQISAHDHGGFSPYTNPVSGRTLWVSEDGRQSFTTVGTATKVSSVGP